MYIVYDTFKTKTSTFVSLNLGWSEFLQACRPTNECVALCASVSYFAQCAALWCDVPHFVEQCVCLLLYILVQSGATPGLSPPEPSDSLSPTEAMNYSLTKITLKHNSAPRRYTHITKSFRTTPPSETNIKVDTNASYRTPQDSKTFIPQRSSPTASRRGQVPSTDQTPVAPRAATEAKCQFVGASTPPADAEFPCAASSTSAPVVRRADTAKKPVMVSSK